MKKYLLLISCGFLAMFLTGTCKGQGIRQLNQYKAVLIQTGPGYYEKGKLDQFIAERLAATGMQVISDPNSADIERYDPCEIITGLYNASLVAEFGRWMNYANLQFYDCNNKLIFQTSGEKRGTAMSGKAGKQNAMSRALEVFDGYTYDYAADERLSIINDGEVLSSNDEALSQPSDEIMPTAVPESGYKNKYALVIGNSRYSTAPLKNPENDAEAMTRTLKSLGFEVDGYVNLDRRGMRDAVRQFGDKIAKEKGVALFYYAGHGLQSDGANYLIPVDADIQKEYDIQDECVRSDMVLRMLELYENPMNIVILDACRNNPYSRGFRSAERGLAQPSAAPTGSIIAFATAPGRTASDGDGTNGLYTQELIQAMKIPGLTIEEVFKRVRISVLEKSGDEQSPWENSSLTGDFYFMR